MLERKILNSVREWYNNSTSALLIDGARQIGKTTIIRAFLEESGKNYIELNLLDNHLALETFDTATDAKQLMLRISALAKKPLVENETIIFIDGIQEAKDAITPIKFLVQNTNYRFIFSGSLLGVKMQEITSVPVGFLQYLQMYPMDFEEFMMANGVSNQIIHYLKNCFEKEEAVDLVVHKQMMNLFDAYLAVGGMPKAVLEFVETNDLNRVNLALQDIDAGYREDVAKYKKDKKFLIQEIYDLIPSELNSPNKRFILKDLNEKARFFQCETSFTWLKNRGIGLFVHNVDNPVYPLLASKERTLFKLFLCDVGLLSYKLFNGNQIEILTGNTTKNYGAIYEDVVAQELKAHGFELYYNNDKKRGEIDFLIERDHQVIPLEIKSGKDYKRHSALNRLLSNPDFNYQKGYVFSNENVTKEDKIVYLPIYMIMFLQNTKNKKVQKIKLDISALI